MSPRKGPPDESHVAEARRLLTAAGVPGIPPPRDLVDLVARLLADHPQAAERARGMWRDVREMWRAADVRPEMVFPSAVEHGVSGGAATGDEDARVSSWAVSAAIMHRAVVEVPGATQQARSDLEEYLTNCHGAR